MKKQRKRQKGLESITAHDSFSYLPLNVFEMDLGLLTKSSKRRWVLLALIASHRTFSASGTTFHSSFTYQQGL